MIRRILFLFFALVLLGAAFVTPASAQYPTVGLTKFRFAVPPGTTGITLSGTFGPSGATPYWLFLSGTYQHQPNTPDWLYLATPIISGSQTVGGASATITNNGSTSTLRLDGVQTPDDGYYIFLAERNGYYTWTWAHGQVGYPTVSLNVKSHTTKTWGDETMCIRGAQTQILLRLTRTSMKIANPLTVSLKADDTSTATANKEYAPFSTKVTFPANVATQTVPITILRLNSSHPQNGLKTLDISVVANSGIAVEDGTVHISIFDPTVPTVAVETGNADALENGNIPGWVTVKRTTLTGKANSLASPLTVAYTIGGSASTSDYTLANSAGPVGVSGTVIIPAFQDSATISVTPTTDGVVEGDEDVVFTLQPSSGYNTMPESASVTIHDADAPSVIAYPLVSQGVVATATNAVIRFAHSGTSQITINYALDGDARYDVDYSITDGFDPSTGTGQITIPAGENSADLVLLSGSGTPWNGGSSLTLTLLSGTSYSVNAAYDSTSTVHFVEAGLPNVKLTTISGTLSEISGTGIIRISCSDTRSSSITVPLVISGDAKPGTDYKALPKKVVIPAGSTPFNQDLLIVPLRNPAKTGSRNVTVSAFNVSGSNRPFTFNWDEQAATVTIADINVPIVSATTEGDAVIKKGGGTATFVISGTNIKKPTVVVYKLSGDAIPKIDYTAVPQVDVAGIIKEYTGIDVDLNQPLPPSLLLALKLLKIDIDSFVPGLDISTLLPALIENDQIPVVLLTPDHPTATVVITPAATGDFPQVGTLKLTLDPSKRYNLGENSSATVAAVPGTP